MIITLASILAVVFGLGANSIKLYKQLPSDELQPFTPAWYQACSAAFRSFDPKTGLWIQVGGKQRFCRIVKRRVSQ